MKIYPYREVITVSSYAYVDNYDKTIIIDDGNIDLSSLNLQFKDTEIISKDKIFVSKHSSFPSLFLSRIEGIDVSRTISVDKATKIVVDEFKPSVYLKNYWYSEFISSDPKKDVIKVVSTNQITPSGLNNMYRYKTSDFSSYSVDICLPCIVVNLPFELTSLILHYPEKFVLTEKVTDYTNKFLPKLDNDTISSLNSMLSGGDKESVRLGINLLSNYDLTTHIIPISGMIRTNYQKIIDAKCASISAFEKICNICGVNRDDLRNSTVLDFNSKLYKAVNNDNDRLLLKDITINYIKDEIMSDYSRYIAQMGIQVCID